MRRLGSLAALAALTLALVSGCSKSPTQPPAPNPGPGSVAVTPASSVVLVTNSLNLKATLSGTSDSTVTWRLLREPGVNDTVNVGTIVPTGAHSATFTAPPTVQTPGFDLTITVLAVALSDTTVRGTAVIVVPRIKVGLSPASAASVPPGTQIPFTVTVQNAPTPGFNLLVNGIPGGDAGVGTWVQTGTTSTIYTAPSRDTLFIYGLLARSAEDPLRFASGSVTVRAGFAVPTSDPSRSEYAPEWNPIAARVAFVRGGPPWDLVVYDLVAQSEQVLVPSFSWSAPIYDGRIAWSEDGTELCFSEEGGGHRVIGVVNADGSGLTSFAPDGSTDYDEACFFTVASPAVESLYVAQSASGVSSLRAYPLAAASGDPGRLVHQAAPGSVVHWPDAALLPLAARASVGCEESSAGGSSVLNIPDNGNQSAVVVATGAARHTQVRWALPSDGVPWLTYIDASTANVYRVQRSGSTSPQRCYSDFFPESGSDLKADPPIAFHFLDAHVVARLEPDGHSRLWVIGFPPSNIVPVSRALELEYKRAGVWQALSPASWRRRRVSP